MKLTKEELQKMIQDIVAESTNAAIGERIEAAMKSFQDSIQAPEMRPAEGGKSLLANMPFVKLEGDMMTTNQGSVINLRKANSPFVIVSEELGQWAKDFADYLKTGHVSKFLNENVDSAGGYLVPEEFRSVMIMYDVVPTLFWSRATVWPMGSDKISFPKLNQNPDVNDSNFDHFAGVSFNWTEESGAPDESEPSFGMIEMIVHELAGYTEISQTLLDDSTLNLVNFLVKLFRDAWYWVTDKSFISGTGGKQPLGILNDPNTIGVSRQTAATIEFQDVLNMEAAMPSIYDNNSVWTITKKARAALRGQTVSATSKELVLREEYSGIAGGYIMTILGRPAFLADGKVPALGTRGDLILGDWSQYYVGFRQDFSMDSSKHYKFRNNRVAMRCAGRLDGQAANPKAFVILGDKA